ncbi:MAG: glutamine--fructose-6-phosphate transaminase (isomerizing) [Mollicutes bacterium]|nr:glutamine--fructose-6-phosphate transaminase (isomerizing) [Mollicutes bacterium]
MCGIIGYIGKKQPVNFLLEGLKKLEYRGYDSSGIAIKENENIQIIRSIGRIKDLENRTKNTKLLNGNIGIAHTRWATHGEPTEENAHPHQVGNVTLVHNGIIENAEELRENLITDGVKFKSETDTEVACAVINKYYEKDPIAAITKALKELKGSYAFGIIFKDNDKLYAVRKDSPLIIGIGEEENYIASDIAAIINYTNKYILLEDNEIVEITAQEIKTYKDGVEIKKDIQAANITAEEADKGSYKHYMLKEIMEEPIVLARTLNRYINNMESVFDVSKYEEIHIVACGSAMYAGMIGKSLLEEKANIKCLVECASEYRYKKVIYDRKTLVILVSQSGETADTVAAMRKAHEENIDTLAIVNVKTSTIAREAKHVMLIEAGPEIAVATTKAYLLQVAVFSLIALKAANLLGLEKNYNDILKEAENLPKLLKKVLEDKEEFKSISKEIYQNKDVFYIGRGIDYAMCLEGSLKLKEVSYTHSDAYQAGELKHGTISLIEEDVPVFAIITDDRIKDKTESNVIEVDSRKAKVFTITNDDSIKNHHKKYVVPKTSYYLQAILTVPPLQLVGYYVGDLKKLDIDKPRNLAKSVTVE